MNNPKLVSAAKNLFHLLSLAATALAAFPTSLLPQKYAIWLALAASAISGALRVLTTIFPGLS